MPKPRGLKTGKSFGDLRTRYVNTGIDKHFAIRAAQDGDVSAGALEYANTFRSLCVTMGNTAGA